MASGVGRGRVRASRAVWVRRVEAWRESGRSAEEFCRRRRISPATLHWWAWRLRREPSAAESVGLVRVEMEPAWTPVAEAPPFEIVLGERLVIRLAPTFEAAALTRLLDCLEERQRC